MIGIIDYGMGNLLSVRHAIERIGSEVIICETPSQIEQATSLILPGVGSFTACMQNLKSRSFLPALNSAVLEQKKKILGICLGMQAMASEGFEGGVTPGLNWISGKVRILEANDSTLRVPNVGWQEIRFSKHALFQGFSKAPEFYFVHSYHFECDKPEDVAAQSDFGKPFTAAVLHDNIFATQFHPEKSQEAGLRLLANFIDWGKNG